MEKPIVNINIKNLIGTLVIVGDTRNPDEFNQKISKSISDAMEWVLESVLSNTDRAKSEQLFSSKKRDEEIQKDWANYKNARKDNPKMYNGNDAIEKGYRVSKLIQQFEQGLQAEGLELPCELIPSLRRQIQDKFYCPHHNALLQKLQNYNPASRKNL